jgi:hypothetical protein
MINFIGMERNNGIRNITRKKLLLRTLKHEDLLRVPKVTYTDIHAARLNGYIDSENPM